jgi:hypothetical protein
MGLLQARQGGKQLPALFCVPFIVKDNFDTAGMAGTAGSVALLDNVPLQDAQQVRNCSCCRYSQTSYAAYEDRASFPLDICESLPRVSLPVQTEYWHNLMLVLAHPTRVGWVGDASSSLPCQPSLSCLSIHDR